MEQISEIKNSLMNEEFDSLVDSRQRMDYAFDKMGSIETIRKDVHKYISDHKKKNMKSLSKSKGFRQKGNTYFGNKNFEYALYYYTSSVMCAPYPSESDENSDKELTYAFTARSLTFFEMKAYENALFDINCALNLSEIPMKFMERLQLMTHKVYCLCRLRRYYTALALISVIIQLIPCLPVHNERVQTLIKMKEQIVDKICETQQSDETEVEDDCDIIEEHLKNIESFRSSELELCETSLKGRHYKAVEPIPKGKIVAVEKAITGVLFQTFLLTHCHNCFKNVGYRCWPCRLCSQVVFCSEQCAQNAEYHSYECGFIDLLDNLGTNHHLLYRIILLVGPQMAIQLANQNPTVPPVDEFDQKKRNFLKFIQLLDHRNAYNLNTKIPSVFKSIQTAFVLDFFEEFRPKDQSSDEYLKDLSAILDTFNYKAFVNVFGMYEHISKCRAFRGGHIGNAITFESSFFNHSCSPNTYWVFNGQHISVVSTRDIEKDEDVCISYGPYSSTTSFEERQSLLRKRYFFHCNCDECISDAKSSLTLKCNHCSDGFFVCNMESTDKSCLSCGQSADVSPFVKKVDEFQKLFNDSMNEFEKNGSEVTLLSAENCYSDFCEYLYPKSDRMFEINTKLSRSFETIENYRKAMIYSKNILDSLNESQTFRYCIEMVFFSRVYFHYLYKQRKSLTIDEEWIKCFETISETSATLKTLKNKLVQTLDNNSKSTDSQVIEKAIHLIDGCLKSKEQQISIISQMKDKSHSESNQLLSDSHFN